MEISHPEVATGFQEAEEKTVQTYRRTLPANSSTLRAVLADFERPESRTERLRELLQEHYPAWKLPDLWTWNAEQNPERFDAGEEERVQR